VRPVGARCGQPGLAWATPFFRGQIAAASVQPAVAMARPGWALVRPAGARCGRPGLAWARSRPTTAGWDLADRGQGVAGRERSQPLPPFVMFYIFSIFHCITNNMALCCFF
jgi:hypothetical protein